MWQTWARPLHATEEGGGGYKREGGGGSEEGVKGMEEGGSEGRWGVNGRGVKERRGGVVMYIYITPFLIINRQSSLIVTYVRGEGGGVQIECVTYI